jgi:hypothetical protein
MSPRTPATRAPNPLVKSQPCRRGGRALVIGNPGTPHALPLDGGEAVAEARGAALPVGSRPTSDGLVSARQLRFAETRPFAPGALAKAVAS